jgi:HPt (histidine-containing phosphotransfer) domain-containing protein
MKPAALVSAFAAALALLPASALALDMSQQQFIDYSAEQHCLNQKLWDQPAKLEEELMALEEKFGITEDDLDALDALTAKYNADPSIQPQIEEKARTLCP